MSSPYEGGGVPWSVGRHQDQLFGGRKREYHGDNDNNKGAAWVSHSNRTKDSKGHRSQDASMPLWSSHSSSNDVEKPIGYYSHSENDPSGRHHTGYGDRGENNHHSNRKGGSGNRKGGKGGGKMGRPQGSTNGLRIRVEEEIRGEDPRQTLAHIRHLEPSHLSPLVVVNLLFANDVLWCDRIFINLLREIIIDVHKNDHRISDEAVLSELQSEEEANGGVLDGFAPPPEKFRRQKGTVQMELAASYESEKQDGQGNKDPVADSKSSDKISSKANDDTEILQEKIMEPETVHNTNPERIEAARLRFAQKECDRVFREARLSRLVLRERVRKGKEKYFLHPAYLEQLPEAIREDYASGRKASSSAETAKSSSHVVVDGGATESKAGQSTDSADKSNDVTIHDPDLQSSPNDGTASGRDQTDADKLVTSAAQNIGGLNTYPGNTTPRRSSQAPERLCDFVLGPWIVYKTPEEDSLRHVSGVLKEEAAVDEPVSRNSAGRRRGPTGIGEFPYLLPFPQLNHSIFPLIKYILSFYTLMKNSRGLTSLGYCFACFRDRRLLDRFRVLMQGKKLVPGGVHGVTMQGNKVVPTTEMTAPQASGAEESVLAGSSLTSPVPNCKSGLVVTFARMRDLDGVKQHFNFHDELLGHDTNRHCHWFDDVLAPAVLGGAEGKRRKDRFRHFLARNKYVWSPQGQLEGNRLMREHALGMISAPSGLHAAAAAIALNQQEAAHALAKSSSTQNDGHSTGQNLPVGINSSGERSKHTVEGSAHSQTSSYKGMVGNGLLGSSTNAGASDLDTNKCLEVSPLDSEVSNLDDEIMTVVDGGGVSGHFGDRGEECGDFTPHNDGTSGNPELPSASSASSGGALLGAFNGAYNPAFHSTVKALQRADDVAKGSSRYNHKAPGRFKGKDQEETVRHDRYTSRKSPGFGPNMPSGNLADPNSSTYATPPPGSRGMYKSSTDWDSFGSHQQGYESRADQHYNITQYESRQYDIGQQFAARRYNPADYQDPADQRSHNEDSHRGFSAHESYQHRGHDDAGRRDCDNATDHRRLNVNWRDGRDCHQDGGYDPHYRAGHQRAGYSNYADGSFQELNAGFDRTGQWRSDNDNTANLLSNSQNHRNENTAHTTTANTLLSQLNSNRYDEALDLLNTILKEGGGSDIQNSALSANTTPRLLQDLLERVLVNRDEERPHGHYTGSSSLQDQFGPRSHNSYPADHHIRSPMGDGQGNPLPWGGAEGKTMHGNLNPRSTPTHVMKGQPEYSQRGWNYHDNYQQPYDGLGMVPGGTSRGPQQHNDEADHHKGPSYHKGLAGHGMVQDGHYGPRPQSYDHGSPRSPPPRHPPPPLPTEENLQPSVQSGHLISPMHSHTHTPMNNGQYTPSRSGFGQLAAQDDEYLQSGKPSGQFKGLVHKF